MAYVPSHDCADCDHPVSEEGAPLWPVLLAIGLAVGMAILVLVLIARASNGEPIELHN